jgi:hypothetical protein
LSIFRQIVLRHQSEGYLRFSLPDFLCQPEVAASITAGLTEVSGIYGVSLYQGQKKLAIRFTERLCSARQVMRHLHAAVAAVLARPARLQMVSGSSSTQPVVMRPISFIRLWLLSKWREISETAQAFWIILRRAYHASGFATGQQPRWLKDFMNDLLMLFLIKIHWHQLLTEWLPRPWTYRYEWAATIYLVYLSVQAKAQRTG